MSKFNEAVYEKNGHRRRIHIDEVTKEKYEVNFKGNLYCPNVLCSARLSYVEWEKTNSFFFRTWKGNKHVDNCNYTIIYSEEEYIKKKTGINRINISDDHIKSKLNNAYFDFLHPEAKKKVKTNGKTQKNSPEELIEDVGVASPSLFGEGQDSENGKEPRIDTRLYSQLSESDNGRILCVIGHIDSIRINEEHAYINMTPKVYESISIYMNPGFKKEFSAFYKGLSRINEYFQSQKKIDKVVIVCCIGQVDFLYNEKTTFKYNISVDRDISMTFDGMTYPQLLKKHFIK